MAYGNDAKLGLATYTPLHADRLVSSRGAVTPPGSRQCSCSETLFHVGLVTTAVQLTFISLTDPADPESLGIVPWLPDRTIVIYVSRWRTANHTSMRSTAGVAIANLTCLWCPSLYRLLCGPEVRHLRLPAVDGEEEL
jgi:hypothetical protein